MLRKIDVFVIHKNIFDTQETYQDYGNVKYDKGPSGLSIKKAKINENGKLVFILSNNSEIIILLSL
mgnify:CR=1 FL=1